MATTGAKFPASSVTAAEAPWSDNDWTTPGNIYADDGSNASVTASTFDSPDQTFVLKAYTFNFSAIPDGSTIDGVICVVNCWYANGSVSIDLMQLLNTSLAKVGTNQCATPVALGTGTGGTVTKGSPTDKWGNLLTAAWVKNSNFGVALGFLATGNNADVFVDYVTLEVFYTPPLIVDLSGVPASAGATSVDPLVTLGPIATTPEFAAAVASGMDPAAVLGSLLLEPGFAAALAEAIDPGVQITGGGQTVDLSADPAPALAVAVDPTPVLGSITRDLSGDPATALSEAIGPIVIQGSITVDPGFALALAAALDPAVQSGGAITVDLASDPAMSLAEGVSPGVVLGGLLLAPEVASALAEGINPAVILGQVLVAVSTAEAVAQGADPVVVQGSVLLTPEIAQAPAEGINPAVFQGDVVVVVSQAVAQADAVDPTPVQASIVLGAGVVEAITQALDPGVVYGAVVVIPAGATSLADAGTPVVVVGTIVIYPVDELYGLPGMLRSYVIKGPDGTHTMPGMRRTYKGGI